MDAKLMDALGRELLDLRARRAELDAAITAIETLVGPPGQDGKKASGGERPAGPRAVHSTRAIVACPDCGKQVKAQGLGVHRARAHKSRPPTTPAVKRRILVHSVECPNCGKTTMGDPCSKCNTVLPSALMR